MTVRGGAVAGQEDPGRDDDAARRYADALGLTEVLDAAARASSDGDAVLAPQLRDLTRLHHLIRSRRVVTVLEFGCGWSTLVMAHALELNEQDFGDVCRAELRRSNPFELHFVDDFAQYIEVSLARIPEHLRARVVGMYSPVEMTTFNDRICTQYAALPDICPDFVYLDGPSILNTQGRVNNISMENPDRVPMSCDLLKIEHLLLPGTYVIVDGRSANARFLRANLQRTWAYETSPDDDVTTFEMVEPPLGRFNRRQIEVCLGPEWLERLPT